MALTPGLKAFFFKLGKMKGRVPHTRALHSGGILRGIGSAYSKIARNRRIRRAITAADVGGSLGLTVGLGAWAVRSQMREDKEKQKSLREFRGKLGLNKKSVQRVRRVKKKQY